MKLVPSVLRFNPVRLAFLIVLCFSMIRCGMFGRSMATPNLIMENLLKKYMSNQGLWMNFEKYLQKCSINIKNITSHTNG